MPLAWLADIGGRPDRLNPHGGAIALGHPLGGSGARIMTTLIHQMRATGIRYGLQTMCEGGGMANATILELLRTPEQSAGAHRLGPPLHSGPAAGDRSGAVASPGTTTSPTGHRLPESPTRASTQVRRGGGAADPVSTESPPGTLVDTSTAGYTAGDRLTRV